MAKVKRGKRALFGRAARFRCRAHHAEACLIAESLLPRSSVDRELMLRAWRTAQLLFQIAT
jgi:hypothetical protein